MREKITISANEPALVSVYERSDVATARVEQVNLLTIKPLIVS